MNPMTMSEMVTLGGVLLSIGYNWRVMHELKERDSRREDSHKDHEVRIGKAENRITAIEVRKEDHERRLSSLETFKALGKEIK